MRQWKPWAVVFVILVLMSPMASADISQPSFEEVSIAAGLTRVGETYGASWGDWNGDSYPDLWVGNHADKPALYSNNGDGTFLDVIEDVWEGAAVDDSHGAAWMDFDNDGDQDLLEVQGGSASNNLFINEGGTFLESGILYGLGFPGSRGRLPLWLDINLDGQLDAILTHELNGTYFPTILMNTGSMFVDGSLDSGVGEPHLYSGYLADLTGNGNLEVIFSNGNPNAGPIYDISSLPWSDVRDSPEFSSMPAILGCRDMVLEDLNGDLRTDLFAVCAPEDRQLVQRSDTRIEIKTTALANETAVEFASNQALQLSVFPAFSFDVSSHLRLGSGGTVPSVTLHPELGWRSFTVLLDPSDINAQGVPSYAVGADLGLFISYDQADLKWRVAFSSPTAKGISLVLNSTAPITDVASFGFSSTPNSALPYFSVRTDEGFRSEVVSSGLNILTPCSSAVGGDFDNDMDIDIYLVCTYSIENLPNRLLINDGNGHFLMAESAGGAEGSSLGVGDSAAIADFDMDGFLDLVVTNGSGGAPFNNGPIQLFRNAGNMNSWVQLDLVGSISNRDAVGATVRVVAGGKSQVRTLSGGMHTKAQNHKRLHFGLGDNQVISELHIRWPSGMEVTFNQVPVNRLLTIDEAGSPDADEDGYPDFLDNCLLVVNPDQRDSDSDGFGNYCDADLDNNGIVNLSDFSLFRQYFGTNNPDADLDGDGIVNLSDFSQFRALFGAVPGPSAFTL